ncbi:MAG TPA: CHRD domain-containing protein [Rhodocyclaceae bacterium]|nr:CHRD domain-containing protein [Rhodocyclaceae bacterium]
MKRLIIASLLVGLAASAQATVIFSGKGTLTGAQEVPPHMVPGMGTATVTVDNGNDLNPNTNRLSWDIIFSKLTTNITAAHFHGPAQPGMNAPIKVPITGSLLGAPGTSGELKGSANISAADFRQLTAGLWYANIHTVRYPDGEIRGQITGSAPSGSVPEPSSMALLGLALAGLALPGLRNRRKTRQ